MSIKQSEVELNHSSEQCSELFFKTLGLLFLNGPGEENVKLLTLGLENCRQCGLISQEEYEELSKQLDLQLSDEITAPSFVSEVPAFLFMRASG